MAFLSSISHLGVQGRKPNILGQPRAISHHHQKSNLLSVISFAPFWGYSPTTKAIHQQTTHKLTVNKNSSFFYCWKSCSSFSPPMSYTTAALLWVRVSGAPLQLSKIFCRLSKIQKVLHLFIEWEGRRGNSAHTTFCKLPSLCSIPKLCILKPL